MAEISDLSSRVRDNMEVDSSQEPPQKEPPQEDEAPVWNARNARDIPSSVREALHACHGSSASKAIFRSTTSISGFVHSIQERHIGNSQIFFSTTGSRSSPGFIQYIFSLEHDTREFLAIRRLLPPTVEDPFRHYPLLGVQIFDSSVGDFEIITTDDVDAQFASCPLVWEGSSSIAVISLSRVRQFHRNSRILILIFFLVARRCLVKVGQYPSLLWRAFRAL